MTVNIAQWPKAKQEAIQHDLMASLWVHNVKIGKMSKADIEFKIRDTFNNPELQQHLRNRVDYYMHMPASGY
ncbi:hypothetical protein [Flocculibacter collagenilyticus]|uniref:hypothetical protein n=1 Tax=Flocculibacter collagenilyticus TaxID=2744479 RepID=UPI0018F4FCA6|nr:hypothetical protein [Flocculibacter collagenilyticus]